MVLKSRCDSGDKFDFDAHASIQIVAAGGIGFGTVIIRYYPARYDRSRNGGWTSQAGFSLLACCDRAATSSSEILTMPNSLTSHETNLFRAFQRQVHRLRKSTLLRSGKVSLKKRVDIDLVTGEKNLTFSGYDSDALQAQLPIFRQFILRRKNDEISFDRIANIVAHKCPRAELCEWIAEAKGLWANAWRRMPSLTDQSMFAVSTSLEEAVDKLFYGFGGLFHVDVNQPDEESATTTIEEALLHEGILHLWRCLNIVDSVIWWWLDQPTASVPAVAKINIKNAGAQKRI